MNYWKVIFATAVIFGAGVFTGGLLVNMVRQTPSHSGAAHHPSGPAPNPGNGATNGSNNANSNTPPRLPEVFSKPFLPKLDDQLHLSSEQYTNIEKIIVNAQAATRKVMQDTRAAIRAELTPEQKAIYDQLMKRPGSAGKRISATTNALENLMWTNPNPPTVVAPAATNR